jgi:hypothetical protein
VAGYVKKLIKTPDSLNRRGDSTLNQKFYLSLIIVPKSLAISSVLEISLSGFSGE